MYNALCIVLSPNKKFRTKKQKSKLTHQPTSSPGVRDVFLTGDPHTKTCYPNPVTRLAPVMPR